MNYQSILKKFNLTIEQASPSIRKKINEIIQLEDNIKKVTEMLSTDNLSAKKREKMEADLEMAQEAIPVMDNNLCKAIETWYPKRDQYAAKGQQLKAAREAKKNVKEPANVVNKPAQATNGTTEPVNKPNDPPGSPKKKTTGGWGWVGLAVIALLATVVGISVHNTNGK